MTLAGGTKMTVDEFIRAYEVALASQSWASVEPLVHENACVTFSNGTVHKGRAPVAPAFTANFAAIEDETYRISNVHWTHRADTIAVYLFDYAWSGRIGGQAAAGAGRGTSVIVREGSDWQLLVEHLGPAPAQPAI